ncbi:oxidoreductase [Natrinema hispanicum]|uniref:NAD(P)-dependent dehydrogenase, short-chain alcohol dehydrogenase family n=1 Tax=Natrinema hispanicum TaxID=392421 RepID=A0A1I0F565_9EURY|nr:oxidoreductase [Natrinema hispanicum]SDD02024.1 NAD(P)-dependent dehydrogenase, short-chain alcohol dehydrogenase family [Natrinema hispanicum]SET53177.1 NAD(P)-dependent dehydrogenase, short-chain alcohol dehydrogenase family [Natrinema hispanicum]
MGWTADNIPDQEGRQVVVTGANSGIGLEATRELARNGATVIMACRSTERGQDAARDIRADIPDADLRPEACDLGDLESIHAFADRLGDADLDVLINNAGVMAIPRSETVDGFETQFGVNHLSHFALTGLLLENLHPHDASESRIVTVSSGIHERGEIDFDDLQHEQSYDPWDAYAQSKLANVLFAYELERRLLTAAANAKSIAVHPGYANTQLQFRGPEQRGSRLRKAAMWAMNTALAQSAAMGALPTLYAATAPEAEGGAYYGPGGFMNMRGTPERQASSKQSYDEETARRLWAVSSELTGVTYDLPEPKAEVSA